MAACFSWLWAKASADVPLSRSVDVSADLHQLKNQSSPFSYCAACPNAALEMLTEAEPVVNYSDSAPDNPC